jgi:hypothetical protein
MKAYGGVDVNIHIFLTSALVGGEWLVSRPSRFTPGGLATCSPSVGGWVGPRTGLDNVEKREFLTLPGLELRPLGRPGRSQLLYQLRYLVSYTSFVPFSKWREIYFRNAINQFIFKWNDSLFSSNTELNFQILLDEIQAS